MPDMAEKYGVDTKNTFAALEDDVEKEKEKDGKTEEKKKDAPARKKVEKKDKEKHGKVAKSSPPVETQTRAKKHEFDRRPGPGAQRKLDKRTGGGKWDKEPLVLEDAQFPPAQEQDDTPAPEPNQATPTDTKDAKDKKEEKAYLDLDEFRAAQQKLRPEGDELKPRAARNIDGKFRDETVKEFVKERTGNLKIDLPKVEVKEKKSRSAAPTAE